MTILAHRPLPGTAESSGMWSLAYCSAGGHGEPISCLSENFERQRAGFMNKVHEDTSIVLLEKVGDWLVKSALAGAELAAIIAGFCERLAAAGLPLARIHFTFSVLHPLYRATGFTWLRGKGVTAESYRHV